MRFNLLVSTAGTYLGDINFPGGSMSPFAAMGMMSAFLDPADINYTNVRNGFNALNWTPNSGSAVLALTNGRGVCLIGPDGAVPFKIIRATHRAEWQLVAPVGGGQVSLWNGNFYVPSLADNNKNFSIYTRGKTNNAFQANVAPAENNSFVTNEGYFNSLGYQLVLRPTPFGFLVTVSEMIPPTTPLLQMSPIPSLFLDQSVQTADGSKDLSPQVGSLYMLSQYQVEVDDALVSKAVQAGKKVYACHITQPTDLNSTEWLNAGNNEVYASAYPQSNQSAANVSYVSILTPPSVPAAPFINAISGSVAVSPSGQLNYTKQIAVASTLDPFPFILTP